MSTRDIAYQIFQQLSDEQLRGFILMFRNGNAEIPNEDMLEAFQEVEDMKKHPENYKHYSDVDEMMRDLAE